MLPCSNEPETCLNRFGIFINPLSGQKIIQIRHLGTKLALQVNFRQKVAWVFESEKIPKSVWICRSFFTMFWQLIITFKSEQKVFWHKRLKILSSSVLFGKSASWRLFCTSTYNLRQTQCPGNLREGKNHLKNKQISFYLVKPWIMKNGWVQVSVFV